MTECWLPIPGYAGYEVSDRGRVRSTTRRKWCRTHWRAYKGRVLKLDVGNTHGHLQVKLGARSRHLYVHDLVLTAFVGPRPPKSWARHWDDDGANNTLLNLSWATPRRNAQDKKWNRGTTLYVLSPAQVKEIKRAQQNWFRGQDRRLAEKYGTSPSLMWRIRHNLVHLDVSP